MKAALAFGGCTLDPKTFELKRGEKCAALSAREVKLFQLFITTLTRYSREIAFSVTCGATNTTQRPGL
jgi:hypothetical protein